MDELSLHRGNERKCRRTAGAGEQVSTVDFADAESAL
jgi:hypothetical protein